MLGDDSVADAEAEARAFADRLGGVERIKNPRGVLHSGAAVGEFHENIFFVYPGSDPKIALCGVPQNRVNCVVNQVQENLLQLVRIGWNKRKILRQLQVYADLVHPKLGTPTSRGIFQ